MNHHLLQIFLPLVGRSVHCEIWRLLPKPDENSRSMWPVSHFASDCWIIIFPWIINNGDSDFTITIAVTWGPNVIGLFNMHQRRHFFFHLIHCNNVNSFQLCKNLKTRVRVIYFCTFIYHHSEKLRCSISRNKI